jgi:hypothetical protein
MTNSEVADSYIAGQLASFWKNWALKARFLIQNQMVVALVGPLGASKPVAKGWRGDLQVEESS